MTDQPSPSKTPITRRHLSIAIVIGLTLLSGVVHGYLDGRWSRSDNLKAIGGQLGQLPDRCGDWALVESLELDEDASELLRCYGSEVRVYRNERTDALVNVAVLFGPRGPIAVHTPEVCYSSIGTKQVSERQRETVVTDGERQQLWSVQFSRSPSPEPVLDVWYAWSDGGDWQASERPRFWLTDNLYKIQVAGPVANDTGRPCKNFLEVFLPQLTPLIQ